MCEKNALFEYLCAFQRDDESDWNGWNEISSLMIEFASEVEMVMSVCRNF